MKVPNDDMVSNWLAEKGNPAIEKLTKINIESAGKIRSILTEKGFDSDTLANIIDFPVSEVNKWLDGNHNFSEKTLGEIHSMVKEAI
ncbi:hypothetical protein [Pedobacter sp.]|uniref:hypothetical protein n=1 Tax=Pedobacter sp. TaxID=1411316 RepID=UPI003D7F5975